MVSNGFVVDVGRDHLGDFLTFPLGSHVASALHGDKVQTVELLDVAGHLTVGVPWSPGLFNLPVELLNPQLAAVGGDGAIGVARVEHEFSLVLQHSVDPLGSFVLCVVLEDVGA